VQHDRHRRGWNARRAGGISNIMQIEVWRSVPEISIAPDFGAIVTSARVPGLVDDVGEHGGFVLAARTNDELRGYAALVPSSALTRERWENLPDLFELGSLEVARSARGQGIGTSLLSAIAGALPVDDLLLFARGFVSHWDLAREGAPAPVAHRRRLLHMLGKIGFQRWDTSDPEVTDHPLNFLAFRAGQAAPAASVLAFAERAID
jgi:GNAT superfamily N-acetyltransferase